MVFPVKFSQLFQSHFGGFLGKVRVEEFSNVLVHDWALDELAHDVGWRVARVDGVIQLRVQPRVQRLRRFLLFQLIYARIIGLAVAFNRYRSGMSLYDKFTSETF